MVLYFQVLGAVVVTCGALFAISLMGLMLYHLVSVVRRKPDGCEVCERYEDLL